MQEMMTAANEAFSMAPLLSQGAIDALLAHGDETIKETWLPKMVSGEWTATMNLSEPQAGSDVGAVRTRAQRQGDGTYRDRTSTRLNSSHSCAARMLSSASINTTRSQENEYENLQRRRL